MALLDKSCQRHIEIPAEASQGSFNGRAASTETTYVDVAENPRDLAPLAWHIRRFVSSGLEAGRDANVLVKNAQSTNISRHMPSRASNSPS
ncbi:hypothetical protein CPLU01_00506 [Colletotrichum plurivorum]|uniref:Uncharacterized protein n=1 Tax=Colletotrichum plurivorum TaxID=2175906 RepID=A0A8H6NRR7_9PEZI|nr:hypothetical protein CPLU01_00506 [Colletotrichum plurivorum]